MNFIKILLMAMVGLSAAFSVATADEPAECVRHDLSQSDVRQRVRHFSGLRPFARWHLVSSSLGPCVTYGLVAFKFHISSPEGFSRFGVLYELSLAVKVDGASGAVDRGNAAEYKAIAVAVRKAVSKAESVDTVRRFIQRFSVDKAHVEFFKSDDSVHISYEARLPAKASGEKTVKLVFDDTLPGGIASVSLPHGDSLPVLPGVLRMLEVVSSRYPGCQVGWIDGNQRHGQDSLSGSNSWNFSVILHGKGCPSSCTVSLAPDGSGSKVDAARTADGKSP